MRWVCYRRVPGLCPKSLPVWRWIHKCEGSKIGSDALLGHSVSGGCDVLSARFNPSSGGFPMIQHRTAFGPLLQALSWQDVGFTGSPVICLMGLKEALQGGRRHLAGLP